jgi:hypothetical protein
MLYSGDIELALAQSNRTVVAHTNKHVIYEFWAAVKTNKEKVAAAAQEFYPQLDSVLFHYLQESWSQFGDVYTRAAFFFLLNRCSEYGKISTGGIDKARFTPESIRYLKNFEGSNFYPFWDKEEDALEGLSLATHTDFILLPVGKFNFNLFEYGKSRGPEMTSINHRDLHAHAQSIEKKMIIVYQKHPRLFQMYSDYNIHMIDKYGRTTQDRADCEEMVIANF